MSDEVLHVSGELVEAKLHEFFVLLLVANGIDVFEDSLSGFIDFERLGVLWSSGDGLLFSVH